MSDISKKIFSIEPEADEDTSMDLSDSLEIPEPVEDDSEEEQAPIMELVEPIDEPEEPVDYANDLDIVPQIKLRPVIHSIVEPVAERPVLDSPPERRPLFAPQQDNDPKPIADIVTPYAAERPISDPPIARPAPAADIRPLTLSDPITLDLPRARRWVAPVLALGAAIGIGAIFYAYLTAAPLQSPIGLAALILAATLPAVAIIALLSSVRASREIRAEASRLAQVSDRLTRIDTSVGNDVSALAETIRRELATVDTRLAETRRDVETLGINLSEQAASLQSLSQDLVERSATIATTLGEQNEAFGALSGDFGARMSDLSDTLERQGKTLEDTSDRATARVSSATEALEHATRLTREHGETLDSSATAAAASVTEAEARLSALLERVSLQRDELDEFLESRISALNALSERLSDEKPLAETALNAQAKSLSAVDAQIEMTEGRLSDLLNRVGEVQDDLATRLADIDESLKDADERARAFTADIAERASDSVAQTRREMSVMESGLRKLQSRMDEVSNAIEETERRNREVAMAKVVDEPRSQIKPLPVEIDAETDDAVLSVEMDDLAIPDAETESVADPLDLTEIVEAPSEVVRRPSETVAPAARPFGRRAYDRQDKNWQWRDMLGSLDGQTDTPPAKPKATIERPGPGIPLRAPERKRPEEPAPEGSDVVARLCEVELAPSAVLNDAVISQAAQARDEGGEARQNQTVFGHLNAPVIHLRGVLAADLEFRLRAESFRRHYDDWLLSLGDASRVRAELATAAGRAYLLCAAALSAS